MKRLLAMVAFLGKTLALVGVFAASVVVAALLHLQTGLGLRVAKNETNAALTSLFRGTIHIDRIGSVGLTGASGIDAHVVDEDGVEVISARGAGARVDVLALGYGAIAGGGPLVIRVEDVKVESARVSLDRNAKGDLRIAGTFLPRKPTPPSTEPSRPVEVHLTSIRLDRAKVVGEPAANLPVDAELRDLRARVDVETPGVVVTLEDGRVDVTSPDFFPPPPPSQKAGATPTVRAPVHPAHISVRGALAAPSAGYGPLAGRLDLAGEVFGVALRARTALRGDTIDAAVLIPQQPGERIGALTGAPLVGPLSLRVRAFGPLAGAAFLADATLDAGTVRAGGTFAALGTPGVRAEAAAQRVDVTSVGGPASNLDARTQVALQIPSGKGPTGTARLLAGPGTVAGQPTPATTATVHFDDGDLVADAVAEEPGAPTTVHAEMKRDGPLFFTTDTQANLGAFRRVAIPLGGGIHARTEGRLDLARSELIAEVRAGAGAITGPGGLRVAGATVEAHVSGPLSSLAIGANVHVEDVHIGPIEVEHARAESSISVGPVIAFRDTDVHLVSHGEHLRLVAPEVRIQGAHIQVVDAEVRGVGAPIEISADFANGSGEAAVRAPDIDIDRVGRLISLSNLGGHATLMGSARLQGNEVEGDVVASLDHGAYGTVHGARGFIRASLEQRNLAITGNGDVGDFGSFEINAPRIHLPGPALAPQSISGIYGRGRFRAGADLQKLGRLVPQLADYAAAGKLRVEGRAGRDSAEVPPEMKLSASTQGLSLTIAPEPGSGNLPTMIAGLDAAVNLQVDATSGFAAVASHVFDKHGVVAAIDVKSNLPYAALFEQVQADLPRFLDTLSRTPFRATLVVPDRKLAQLPAFLHVEGVQGRADVVLNVEGTARAPRVDMEATLKKFRAGGLGPKLATDVAAELRYDGALAELTVTGSTAGGGRADVEAKLRARVKDLFEGKTFDSADWTAEAKVVLAAFPLQVIPALQAQRVRGEANGHVELLDLHKNARVEAAFTTKDLKVARASFPKFTVTASAKGDAAEAKVHVEQTDGHADLVAKAGIDWGAKWLPALRSDRPVDATLVAKSFRAAALSPFVGSQLTDLDGRIDADAKVTAGADGKNVKMGGYVAFSEGSFAIPAMGQEYRAASARVTLENGGTLRLSDARVTDPSGTFYASGAAHLRDLEFLGAEATVSARKTAPGDLTIQGQSMGDVWGEWRAKVVRNPGTGEIAIAIDTPSTHATLSESSGRSLQALEAPANIRVGMYEDGEFRMLARTATDLRVAAPAATTTSTLRIKVHFGDDVELRRGPIFQVRFKGDLTIVVAQKVSIEGQLVITGGRVDLQGKKFDFERGTVTFGGEEFTNPIIVATAGWTAGDKTRVYADFVGPVKTGKVTLRSEPALSQNQIFSLILFGTPDGMNGPSPGQKPNAATQAATTVGGGAIAQGLDKAAFDVTGIETQTRIDTTNANNPRPELEVMIARDISLQFAHVLGTPPLSEPDLNLGTVRWRFAPNWTLSGTFGDRGKASVDAVWNHLY